MWRSRACLFGGVGVIAVIAACASGGAATGDDVTHDAPLGQHDSRVPSDARATADAPRTDASVMVDAFVPPDAPPGAFICSLDSDCSSGECCFDFRTPPGFCVAGVSVFGVCVPSGN